MRDADATRALAGAAHANDSTATRRIPAPRRPFFIAWLVVAAALWWLERTKVRESEN
jgi:hypothetical protein